MRAAILSLLIVSILGTTNADRHGAVRRQAPPAVAGQSTFTVIIPSPGASAVPVTSQYQAVTSYVPIMTVCSLAATQVPSDSPSSCSTAYTSTITTVCHTELQALASVETVTDCNQDITFSRDYGYSISAPPGVSNPLTLEPSDAPPIQTLTTYYQAPWSDLTAGTAPTRATQKVCGISASSNVCVDNWVVPQTRVVTFSRTMTTTIDYTTNIQGPAQVTIETVHMDVTETSTILSLSTVLITEYSTESTTTEYATAKSGASTSVPPSPSLAAAFASPTSLIPTRTLTKTVNVTIHTAPDTVSPSSTTTLLTTSTLTVATTMSRLPTPALRNLTLPANSTT